MITFLTPFGIKKGHKHFLPSFDREGVIREGEPRSYLWEIVGLDLIGWKIIRDDRRLRKGK